MSLIIIPHPHLLFLSPLRLYDATRVPLDTLALWSALMTPLTDSQTPSIITTTTTTTNITSPPKPSSHKGRKQHKQPHGPHGGSKVQQTAPIFENLFFILR